MMETGLHEVPNPSALFISDYRNDVSGASVFAGMEGTRPMLVKSIVDRAIRSGHAAPRVVGWDGADWR